MNKPKAISGGILGALFCAGFLLAWRANAQAPADSSPAQPAPESKEARPAERKEQPRPEAPPIEGADEWRRLDDELLRAPGEFGELERRHSQLVQEFRKNEKNLEPGSLAPAAVLARRNLSQLAGKFDDLLGARRALREKLWLIGRRAAVSRAELAKLLDQRKQEIEAKKPDERSAAEKTELDRIARWRRGIDRADREGPGHFFSSVLGPEVARAMFERGGRGDGGWGRAGDGRDDQGRRGSGEREGRPAADRPEPVRDRPWIERQIRSLERQDARAKEEALQREERVKKLKTELENLDSGAAEPAPAESKKD